MVSNLRRSRWRAQSLPRQLRKVADKELLKQLEIGLDKVELQLVEAVKHTDPIAKGNHPSSN